MEAIFFSGSHSFKWKPFHLVEAVFFGGSVEAVKETFPVMEAIPLVEVAPFS